MKRRGSGRGSSGTRQRGSSRATLRLGFTAHREKYAKALRLELEEEMARAEERLETWPRERLGKEGYALFGLRGLHDGNLQRDAVVRVLVPQRGAMEEKADGDDVGEKTDVGENLDVATLELGLIEGASAEVRTSDVPPSRSRKAAEGRRPPGNAIPRNPQ